MLSLVLRMEGETPENCPLASTHALQLNKCNKKHREEKKDWRSVKSICQGSCLICESHGGSKSLEVLCSPPQANGVGNAEVGQLRPRNALSRPPGR